MPGPVDVAAGVVDSPAALPGWHGYPLAERVRERCGVPVAIENDANAMALGEYARRTSGGGRAPQSVLLVKAGSAIGCGLVVEGRLFHGATALAGDIAHVRVPDAGDAPCACGKTGCLEAMAGNAAITRGLRAVGIPAATPADTVRLVREANGHAIARVEAAGRLLGATLAAVVNFVNPHLLVLGGPLAECDEFATVVRSELQERCHPLATRALRIEQTMVGADTELSGVGRLALRRVLAAL